MNEIRRIESEASEIARVRAIMKASDMPVFVTGHIIDIDESDDEQVVWIRLDGPLSERGYMHLRKHLSERYPCFRSGHSESTTEQA